MNKEHNIEEIRKSFKYSDDFIKWKGGKLRLFFVESSLVQTIMSLFKIDILMNMVSRTWDMQVSNAMKKFMTAEELADKGLCKGIRKDINKSNRQTHAKPGEYFMYGFRNKSPKERKTYLTDKEMLLTLSKRGFRKAHDLELNDKYNFYQLAAPYFKRDVILVNKDSSYEEFKEFAFNKKRAIFKPIYLGTGRGIFVAALTSEDDIKAVYAKIINSGGDWVAEELIIQSKKMSEFNESSVNTMRVSTFKNKRGIFFHLPTIRTGRAGSVVDNAGSGGITAVVDEKTGIIITDGYDESGHVYSTHPNSGITYKGWQVPEWDTLLQLAKEIHNNIFPNHPYIGWDFAHTDNGWVLIEGNWGQYIGKQVCMGRGLKEEFMKLLNGE